MEQNRQERLLQFLIRNRRRLRVLEVLSLIFLAIIVVAIVIPTCNRITVTTRVDAARGDIVYLGKALELFKDNTGTYPGTLDELLGRETKYVNDSSTPQDPWGKAYTYKCPGTHDTKGYGLISCGPDGIADDITSWSINEKVGRASCPPIRGEMRV